MVKKLLRKKLYCGIIAVCGVLSAISYSTVLCTAKNEVTSIEGTAPKSNTVKLAHLSSVTPSQNDSLYKNTLSSREEFEKKGVYQNYVRLADGSILENKVKKDEVTIEDAKEFGALVRYRYVESLRRQYGFYGEGILNFYKPESELSEENRVKFQALVPYIETEMKDISILDLLNDTTATFRVDAESRYLSGQSLDETQTSKQDGWTKIGVADYKSEDSFYKGWYKSVSSIASLQMAQNHVSEFIDDQKPKIEVEYKNEYGESKGTRPYSPGSPAFWIIFLNYAKAEELNYLSNGISPWWKTKNLNNAPLFDVLNHLNAESGGISLALEAAAFSERLLNLRSQDLITSIWDIRSMLINWIIRNSDRVSEMLWIKEGLKNKDAPIQIINWINEAVENAFLYIETQTKKDFVVSRFTNASESPVSDAIRKYGFHTLGHSLERIISSLSLPKDSGQIRSNEEFEKGKKFVMGTLLANLFYQYQEEYLSSLKTNLEIISFWQTQTHDFKRKRNQNFHDWRQSLIANRRLVDGNNQNKEHPLPYEYFRDDQSWNEDWNIANEKNPKSPNFGKAVFPLPSSGPILPDDIRELDTFSDAIVDYAPITSKIAKYLFAFVRDNFDVKKYPSQMEIIATFNRKLALMNSEIKTEFTKHKNEYILENGNSLFDEKKYAAQIEKVARSLIRSAPHLAPNQYMALIRIKESAPSEASKYPISWRRYEIARSMTKLPSIFQKGVYGLDVTSNGEGTFSKALLSWATTAISPLLSSKWLQSLASIFSLFIGGALEPKEEITHYIFEKNYYGQKIQVVGSYKYQKKILGIILAKKSETFDPEKHISPVISLVRMADVNVGKYFFTTSSSPAGSNDVSEFTNKAYENLKDLLSTYSFGESEPYLALKTHADSVGGLKGELRRRFIKAINEGRKSDLLKETFMIINELMIARKIKTWDEVTVVAEEVKRELKAEGILS